MASIPERDKKAVWHPFTHIKNARLPININKGEGVYLIDDKGNRYIDAFSSWWVNLHGHAHPYIAGKIYEQAKSLEQVAFSNFTHEQAVVLAERLLKHLPGGGKVFYSDNGSTAVEVALKMAIQYHHNKGKEKKKIIALENGYHGDTFGSMSVAERNMFNLPFQSYLFDVTRIPVPVKGKEQAAMEALKKVLQGDEAGAFIFEPLVQGAGGMVMYEQGILNELVKECNKHNCITIADEVMTGFGRTGRFFACDYMEERPCITCLSKGITGGFMPLGATVCTEDIYNAYLSDDKTKTFYHGHSYTANPLACAAANASLDLLEKTDTQKQIEMIAGFFENLKKEFENHTALTSCRNRGAILALELKTGAETNYLNPASERLTEFYLKRGIIVRPLGNILYFIPPYCIHEKELEEIETVTKELLDLWPNV